MTGDPLTQAILAAGKELGQEHDWNFGEGDADTPDPDDVFVLVMRRHVAPLVSIHEVLVSRRDALTAELRDVEILLREAAR